MAAHDQPTLTRHALRFFSERDIDTMPELAAFPANTRAAMRVVAKVLPFRTNNYVIGNLIDWAAVPDDPIFRLTFPHHDMLDPEQFHRVATAASRYGDSSPELRTAVAAVRAALNPHPAGQPANVPAMDEEPVPGVQHKYHETCLIFPASGQTCHAYCTYCFRWPQFVDMKGMRFATDQARGFARYIAAHGEITDVLLTGGDPMIMNTAKLASYVEPFLEPAFDHVRSIRIGTKSLAYWPYRFLTDPDADDLLALIERVSNAGKHVSLMAHVSHWRELAPPPVAEAIARLRNAGATIRVQAPLVRHVNDSADVWRHIWVDSVALGCIPYYMFVERDTGAHRYFSVPLARAHDIFRTAYSQVSGLARTVRGPSMSATPGKVMINGIAEIGGERVFVLTFLQARNPEWCGRPFFARYDAAATWLSDLRPAFGAERFFYEEDAGAGPSIATTPRLPIAS